MKSRTAANPDRGGVVTIEASFAGPLGRTEHYPRMFMKNVMSTESVWSTEVSVNVDVPASFAWRYMTDVRTWNDPPAEFALEGAFANGARGTTTLPGQAPIHWTLAFVDPGRGYTVSSVLSEGASILFDWQFAILSDDRCRLTQRLELHGDRAGSYVNDVRAAFGSNLEPGMRRIAAMMQAAAERRG